MQTLSTSKRFICEPYTGPAWWRRGERSAEFDRAVAEVDDGESFDPSHEHVLVAANAAEPTQLIIRPEVDSGIAGEVGVEDRARRTGVYQDVRNLDRGSAVRQRRSNE